MKTGFVVLIIVAVIVVVVSIVITFCESYSVEPTNNINEPVVWTYWEGDKPPFIQLCDESIQYYCDKTPIRRIHITPDTLDKYLKLPPKWHRMKNPAQKSDILRAALLYHYGGIWLDSDVVAVEPFDKLLDCLKATEFFCFRLDEGNVTMSCIVARKGSRIAHEWLNRALKRLRKGLTSYRCLGVSILKHVIKNYDDPSIYRSIRAGKTIHPIGKKQYNNEECDTVCKYRRRIQPIIMFINSEVEDVVRRMSIEEIQRSKFPICRLIRNYKTFGELCENKHYIM